DSTVGIGRRRNVCANDSDEADETCTKLVKKSHVGVLPAWPVPGSPPHGGRYIAGANQGIPWAEKGRQYEYCASVAPRTRRVHHFWNAPFQNPIDRPADAERLGDLGALILRTLAASIEDRWPLQTPPALAFAMTAVLAPPELAKAAGPPRLLS